MPLTRRSTSALTAALLVVLTCGRAMADSACDKPRDDFDGLYCLSKVYQHSDSDLNSAFSRLRGRLDDAGRSALRAGQITWLQTRDQSCSKHDDNGFYVNLACATQTTIARTEFLQSRYRECVSSGCMDSRLK